MAKDATSTDSKWQRWHDEFEAASKAKGYKQWQTRARKIIKRYRDDRGDGDGASDGMASDTQYGSRFNILWSNVQTLLPALFAKTPKPVVERRYLDRDDVGRTASVILERALLYELDGGGYQTSLRKALLDRLLPGRGVVWVRYEPKFVPMDSKTQTSKGEVGSAPARPEGGDGYAGAGETGDEELASPDQTETGEEVASESTCIDYVDWNDFQTSPARTWEEVWWISKRVYMTRAELVKRFPKCGKDIPLDWSPTKDQRVAPGTMADGAGEGQQRAKIIECWDKTRRKVYWCAENWGDEMLDERDDPLRLEGFWPVPKPLFATLTNDSLVPVPDYTEYQDQALELDDLTNRIAWLTKAIKISGVYDGSIPELQRIFQEGKENELVGVDNMAEFSSKAGPNGMGVIWLAPIAEMMKCLSEMYVAREQVKQSLYEITGISDIIRGGAQPGGAKTATEQRIKGQFASMRLNDMQAEVARFARDTLRIMGEIIAEHFDPMTLYLVSGFEQYAKEQWPPQQGVVAPAPQMGHNNPPPGPMPGQVGGQPPMLGAPSPSGVPNPGMGAAPPMMPSVDPAMVAQQKAAAMFKSAVELLRSDKLRGFRIDIETDSLIEADQQQMQESRTALLGAISQFLPQAIEAGTMVPELKPLMARLLMFFLRGYKASRDIESAFEQFIDDVTKEAANPKPKPPTPEEQKIMAEREAQQAESARLDKQAQIDQAMAQQKAAQDKQAHDFKMEEMQRQAMLEERATLLKLEADAIAAETVPAGTDAEGNPTQPKGPSAEERVARIQAILGGQAPAAQAPAQTDQVLRELVEKISRPRRIIRGPDGKAIGLQ